MRQPLNIRLGELPRHVQKKRPRHCQECGEPTREGKPFCKEHVHMHPYVANLLAQIDQRAADVETANKGHWRKLDPDGPACQDVMSNFLAFNSHPRWVLDGLTLVGVYACARAMELFPEMCAHSRKKDPKKGGRPRKRSPHTSRIETLALQLADLTEHDEWSP